MSIIIDGIECELVKIDVSNCVTPSQLARRLRRAAHDERLATGALYLEAAEMIEAMEEAMQE